MKTAHLRASLLLALALSLGSCTPTAPSALHGGSAPGGGLTSGDNSSTEGAPLSVQEEAEALVVETLSEVSAPESSYALKSDDITAAEAEGLELSDEEWQVLQALAVQAPSQ